MSTDDTNCRIQNALKIYTTGFNGFGQFKNIDKLSVTTFSDWPFQDLINSNDDFPNEKFKLFSAQKYNAIAMGNRLHIFGVICGKFNQIKTIRFTLPIREISGNDQFCLILLENGICQKLLLNSMELSDLNFLNIESNVRQERKSIFNELMEQNEFVKHISCGGKFSLAVTNENSLYNIPNKIFIFPKNMRIVKIVCGVEHALFLTSNGDVYVWGSSSRGQLGLESLETVTSPVQLDALAGIKIIDIGAGAWHSAAISVFGDLYMWGWNSNGQIGKKLYGTVDVQYEHGRCESFKHKLPSVYLSPQLIDLFIQNKNDSHEDPLNDQYKIENVCCGSRHTIIKTNDGKLLASGWNSYGQLGLEDSQKDYDQFQLLENTLVFKDLLCGSWCTLLINY